MRRPSTNREHNQMIFRAPLLFVLGSFAATGCLQQLDPNASSGNTNVTVDPALGSGGPFPIIEDTPPIAIKTDPNTGDPLPGQETADPCVKTIQDSVDIRTKACGSCHEASKADGKVLGDPLNHILDPNAIVNVASPTMAWSKDGWKYIVPGNPEASLIYHRVAVVQDMPKPPTDVNQTAITVSISDMSVLRAWIMCLATTN
jgi:hypothetical protein